MSDSFDVTPKFEENSPAYIRAKSIKGILEQVWIKFNLGLVSEAFLYKDTFNEKWEESELCTYEEALEIIANIET